MTVNVWFTPPAGFLCNQRLLPKNGHCRVSPVPSDHSIYSIPLLLSMELSISEPGGEPCIGPEGFLLQEQFEVKHMVSI